MRRLIILALAASCGGSDGAAAPDAAPGAITLTDGSFPFPSQVTGFKWGANNDCPTGGGAVVSVTIQASGAGGAFGLCLPRPDLIGAAPLDLANASQVLLVGASAKTSECTVTMTTGATPAGSVTFTSFSTAKGASYQMTLAGNVAAKASCPGQPFDAGPSTIDVTLELGGTALVAPQ